jgi:hypothetical protein
MEVISASHTVCMNTECLSATCLTFCILEKIIRDILCCHREHSPVASPPPFYNRIYVV